MTDIILFGGTSEGRELGALLREYDVPVLVCVATEYGQSQLDSGGLLRVQTGKLDKRAMQALFIKEAPRLVIDATHPFAFEASLNIKNACGKCGIRHIRVRREMQRLEEGAAFSDLGALIGWLQDTPGVIFSALGVKEAASLTGVKAFEKRVWLRILPAPEGLAKCLALGFPEKHIICMQGPFSTELNEAMFRAAGADILVTKESGGAGGYAEKMQAARRCGMRIAVLLRPEEEGLTLAEMRMRIEENRL